MKRRTRRRYRAKARKPRRKQPRRMTPPLVLRDDETAERQIIELDDTHFNRSKTVSGRVTVFLTLAPGLKIDIGSRCQNKRRITHLKISPFALGYFEGHSPKPPFLTDSPR